MIEFLKENYRLIIDIVCVVVSLILFLTRKKPIKIVDSVKASLIASLPEVINRVEKYTDVFDPSRKLSSEEKLRLALDICKSYMVDELGVPEDQLCLYTSWLVDHIEDILSTPQKKGD